MCKPWILALYRNLVFSPLKLKNPGWFSSSRDVAAPCEPICMTIFRINIQIVRPNCFDRTLLAPPVGLEPTTLRLTAACSTIVAFTTEKLSEDF